MRSEYPGAPEVEAADVEQLVRWNRFLPPPGIWAAGLPTFRQELDREALVIARIIERLEGLRDQDAAAYTAASKRIGWTKEA